MPYVLSPIIKQNFVGMWAEGAPYQKQVIYDINSNDPKAPPVNYSSYTLKPHSLPHLETPAHTNVNGKTVEAFFEEQSDAFWGATLVIKLPGANFVETSNPGIKIWHISLDELQLGISRLGVSTDKVHRVLIGLVETPLNAFGNHDENYVLILSQEAANFLSACPNFKMYGTSWKSSDFKPGSKERPIHKKLFEKGLILECLRLDHVPEGVYFMNAFPIPLEGASESPVCPVLYTSKEIQGAF
jgi:arylformamidase